MKTSSNEYALNRDRVGKYFYCTNIGLIVMSGISFLVALVTLQGIWFFGIAVLAIVLYAFTLGRWLSWKQMEALRYWLDGSTLRLDQGVFFLKRKAIPLDRITDVMLVQGPLMRWYGIWAIHVQTAGMGGHAVAEGILYGIDDPEGVRDELLRTRDEAASRYRA